MNIQFSVWALLGFAMAAGLVAGALLAFSDFIMKSLWAAQPVAGIEAMQIINRKVFRTIFMTLFMGMVPVSLGVAYYAFFYLDGSVAKVLIVGSWLYFFGVFVVTAAGNVPMNNALEALPTGSVAAKTYWPEYVRDWVRWNHFRWIASLGTAFLYALGAVLLVQAS